MTVSVNTERSILVLLIGSSMHCPMPMSLSLPNSSTMTIVLVVKRTLTWCVVSTVGCDSGVLHMYDNLHTPLYNETVYLLGLRKDRYNRGGGGGGGGGGREGGGE